MTLISPEALLFGFTQAFVVGPLTIFALREGLNPRKGIWYEAQVFMGGTLVDILYLLVAMYGLSQAISQPIVQALMLTGGAIMLMMMSVNMMHEQTTKRISVQHVHKHRFHFPESDFIRGFMLSLLNPLALVFWLIVAGSLYTQYANLYNPGVFAFNIVGGGMIGSMIVLAISFLFRQIINKKVLQKVTAVGSFILIGYGIYFSIKAFSEWQLLVTSILF